MKSFALLSLSTGIKFWLLAQAVGIIILTVLIFAIAHKLLKMQRDELDRINRKY